MGWKDGSAGKGEAHNENDKRSSDVSGNVSKGRRDHSHDRDSFGDVSQPRTHLSPAEVSWGLRSELR